MPAEFVQQVPECEQRLDGGSGLSELAPRARDWIHHPSRQRADRLIGKLTQQVLPPAPADVFPNDERPTVLRMPAVVDRERRRVVGRM